MRTIEYLRFNIFFSISNEMLKELLKHNIDKTAILNKCILSNNTLGHNLITWCFWARGRLAWWLWIFPVNNNSIFIWTSHLLGLPCIKIWSIMLLIILDPIVWIPCILQNQGSTYNMQNEISKALGKSQCSYEYPWIMNMLKMDYQIMFYRHFLQSKSQSNPMLVIFVLYSSKIKIFP